MNKLSEENKAHVDLKTDIKSYDTSEQVNDNAMGIISVQSKESKCHAEKLKENLNYTLKEANDEKMAQKEDKTSQGSTRIKAKNT